MNTETENFVKRVTGLTDLSTIRPSEKLSLDPNYTGWVWWHEIHRLVYYTNSDWHRLDGPAFYNTELSYTHYRYYLAGKEILDEDMYWTHHDVVMFALKKKLKTICGPSVTD